MIDSNNSESPGAEPFVRNPSDEVNRAAAAVLDAAPRAESREDPPAPAPFTIGRDDVKKGWARSYDYVPVPELGPGARARVQSLDTGEINAFEEGNWRGKGHKTKLNMRDATARLLAFGLIDDAGHRIYNPQQPDDVRALSKLGGKVSNRIAKKIRELSGMTAEDEDDEDEGAEGN